MEPQQQQQQQQRQRQQQSPLPRQKHTPIRRGKKLPTFSPRRTYASENDMPSEAVFPLELAGPFTPQKANANSPTPSSQPNHGGKSKARNGHGAGNGRNKGRAKQVSSPGPAKHGRITPPHATATSKSIAAAAFAGATFHASPAPSSLPMPSFLAKALDSPSVQETDHASREPSPPATDSEAAPTPQHRIFPEDAARQESPLDIFFRADRAEKERARRASSANILGLNPFPFSPPSQIRSPVEPKTLPRTHLGSGNNRRSAAQRSPSSGIPTSELDGTPSPGEPIGPALSRPYNERIRAARSNKKQFQPAQSPAASPQDQAAMDMSERLKRFLAIPSVSSEQQSQEPTAPQAGSTGIVPQPFSPGIQPHSQRTPEFLPPFTAQSQTYPSAHMPSPFLLNPHQAPRDPATSNVAPSAANNHGNIRSADILNMEDSLRRMLKLNHAPAPPPAHYQSS
ncbi:uncharacterized protein C8A04DRAFT_9402 [Dichotomopilus funicola]|uniref:Proteophosphoglycan 5 n=1 Tax=Dichotomopilus funicola TaxID=1934379 RepID=A0AAN6V8Y7_9PEZI|nr:hypothetical protein C8A04DRAFT_9402 [Dichotomopilus funicola]